MSTNRAAKVALNQGRRAMLRRSDTRRREWGGLMVTLGKCAGRL